MGSVQRDAARTEGGREVEKKTRSLNFRLLLMLGLILLAFTVVQFFFWRYTSVNVITRKAEQIFDEVNYQYMRQLNERLQFCKKIVDGIKGDTTVLLDIQRIYNRKMNFLTASSDITAAVMRQLNTVSVSPSYVRGVRIYLSDGRSIQCYATTSGISPVGRWNGDIRPEYFDYEWKVGSGNRLSMSTYITEGTRVIGMLTLDFFDEFLSEIVDSNYNKLDMGVSIADTNGTVYYTNSAWGECDDKAIVSNMLLNGGRWIITGRLSGQYIEKEIASYSIVHFSVAMAVLILLLLFEALIFRSVFEPLRGITRGMQEMHAGKLDYRLPPCKWCEYDIVYRNFNSMADRIQESVHTIAVQGERFRDLQIASINAKFNPHFLFNTLDTIRWELEMSENHQMSRTIVQFSKLLRYSVSMERELVEIQKDFQYVGYFLEVHSSFHPGQFDYSVNIEEGVGSFLIPKLFVQPIVENAIRHGFEYMQAGGRIEIRVLAEDGRIVIIVSDNGRGMEAERIDQINQTLCEWDDDGTQVRKLGLGLYLVNGKAKYYYGSACGLTVSDNPDGGLTVVVRITGSPGRYKQQMI